MGPFFLLAVSEQSAASLGSGLSLLSEVQGDGGGGGGVGIQKALAAHRLRSGASYLKGTAFYKRCLKGQVLHLFGLSFLTCKWELGSILPYSQN